MNPKKYKAALIIRTTGINDWSGVPYYVTKAFREYYGSQGLVINATKYFHIPGYVFNKTIAKLFKYGYRLAGKPLSYSFIGSWFYRWVMHFVLIVKAKKINQSGFLFTFVPPYGINKKTIKVPIIGFSDASFEHLIKWQQQRELNYLERQVENASLRAVKKCAVVVCMFPNVYTELINKGFRPDQLILFDKGFNLDRDEQNIDVVKKYNNKMILFIGRKHYKDGALKLIDAFFDARKIIPELNLIIIGIAPGELGDALNNGIVIHQYLDKNIPDQLSLYKSYLQDASLYVNVAEIGGSYMAVIEAMVCHTPFILKECLELKLIFQKKKPSGVFLNEPITRSVLSDQIVLLLSDFRTWEQYSNNAHSMVSDFNWKHLFPKIEVFLNERNA
ncbi:MAG: glycosyltransferase [Salinivirgaceae bacterium]|jgi:glycosyltransferase involved in cell wall biosynthesis|nr:glycosyltransferase [Salinivirgaceae bacterium]